MYAYGVWLNVLPAFIRYNLPCHSSVNKTIRRVYFCCVPAVLELVDVCSEDDKQPDGMSLILWWRGLEFHLALTLAPLLQFVGQGGWWIRSSKAQKRKSTIVFYFAPVCV